MASTGNANCNFTREIEIDSTHSILKIIQRYIGDVGCVVWDAGLVLAKYLDLCHANGICFRNKNIIELGAGTGIVGLVAACLGAHVILTDLPEFVPLLQQNIETNNSVITGSAKANVLCWGEDIKDDSFNSPDIILVADCIYYDMSLAPLINTLIKLCGSQTEIIISYEDRTVGNKQQLVNDFIHIMKKTFTFEVIPSTMQHPVFQSSDIHLLKCRCR